MQIGLKEVKARCERDRFFTYSGFHDRLFVPIAVYLAWLSLRLGVSGNQVSWISGFVAVIGGFMLATNDTLLILIGSFGYIIWYLLDYVDGVVARIEGKGGISGQYIDWIMHVIAHTAIVSGICIGAMENTGAWLLPFVIMSIIASVLSFAKISMGWFAICMEQQQLISKNANIAKKDFAMNTLKETYLISFVRKVTVLFFHENYLIFSILLQHFYYCGLTYTFDLRIAFTIMAAVWFLPIQIYDIIKISDSGKIEQSYNSIFVLHEKPNLPADHFFEG